MVTTIFLFLLINLKKNRMIKIKGILKKEEIKQFTKKDGTNGAIKNMAGVLLGFIFYNIKTIIYYLLRDGFFAALHDVID